MIEEVKGKPLKGYAYADGTHWHWGDEEIAVIEPVTGEIEWCDRKFKFPKEVIEAIRKRRPKPSATFRFDVQRVDTSVSQCYLAVLLNGEHIMSFGDDKELKDGEWVSKTKDEDLGRCVYSAFKYSDKLRDILVDGWRKSEREEDFLLQMKGAFHD